MTEDIMYRKAQSADALKLSVLYKQVYIQTYGTEGVSDEFANFITLQFAPERLEHIIAGHPDNIIVAVYKITCLVSRKLNWLSNAPSIILWPRN